MHKNKPGCLKSCILVYNCNLIGAARRYIGRSGFNFIGNSNFRDAVRRSAYDKED
jgi:hypothetical protein